MTWCYIGRFVRDVFEQMCNTSPPKGGPGPARRQRVRSRESKRGACRGGIVVREEASTCRRCGRAAGDTRARDDRPCVCMPRRAPAARPAVRCCAVRCGGLHDITQQCSKMLWIRVAICWMEWHYVSKRWCKMAWQSIA